MCEAIEAALGSAILGSLFVLMAIAVLLAWHWLRP